MKQIPNELTQNFSEPSVKRELMANYALNVGFSGENENGEIVWVSIYPDKIVVITNQSNGWRRINYYDEEGYPAGEMFDGKWDKPDPEEENVVWLVIENCYEDGVVHVSPFRTHEAASAEFQRIKAQFEKDEIDETVTDTREFFHACRGISCEVKRSVIRDA